MNYMVNKTGKAIKIPAGDEHARFCKRVLKRSLRTLLRIGWIRVKCFRGVIAIEGTVNTRQRPALRQIIRNDVFYTAVFEDKTIRRYERPIKFNDLGV